MAAKTVLCKKGDLSRTSYIPGIFNGVPGKLVGNIWRYSGCYWLIANNDIQSIEDLKGKTIGAQGAAGGMRLSVLKMLEKNGISEDEVTLVANGATVPIPLLR